MTQPFGRQPNGREWILDFMRQAARHFAPGGIALCLQQRSNVVKYQHITGNARTAAQPIAGQRGAGTNQHAAIGIALQIELLTPFGFASVQINATGRDKLRIQRMIVGCAKWLAQMRRHIHMQQTCGGCVDHAHRVVGRQRNYATGQARQNHRQIGALGFHRLLTVRRFFAGARQTLRHVIEGMHQHTHFILCG